jgi:hypothetical protein
MSANLVDMARPWSQIKERNDWRKYDTDRDALMARNIIRDRQAHHRDARHALFIVGAGHAVAGVQQATGEWIKSAGWHLRQERAGKRLCHSSQACASTWDGWGAVRPGLVWLGASQRWPTDHRVYAESRPWRTVLRCVIRSPTFSMRDAAVATLYLGAEADLLAAHTGFYTADHMKEIDRRYRLITRAAVAGSTNAKNQPEERRMAKTWGRDGNGRQVNWVRSMPGNAAAIGGSVCAEALRGGQHPRLFGRMLNGCCPIREADYAHVGGRTMPGRVSFEDTDYLVESGFDGWWTGCAGVRTL